MTKHKRPAISRDAIDPEGAYSVAQVAELIEYHPGSIKRWLADGRIEGFRPNGFEWRIPGSEVLRLLKAKEYTGRLALRRPSAIELGEYNIIRPTQEQLELLWRQFPNSAREGELPYTSDEMLDEANAVVADGFDALDEDAN